nr:hypothetical protein [Actinoplanes lichenicola]
MASSASMVRSSSSDAEAGNSGSSERTCSRRRNRLRCSSVAALTTHRRAYASTVSGRTRGQAR